MSIPPKLEKALRHLSAHPAQAVIDIADKFGVPKADIWAWLAAHNRSRKELPAHVIDSVAAGLASTPRRKAGAAAERRVAQVAAATGRVVDRELVPAKPGVPALRAAIDVPHKWRARAVATAPDDGASPWQAFPCGPRAGTLAAVRADLERLAAGELAGPVAGKLRSFCSHWLGTVRPAPERVRRFIDWLEAAGAKRAAAPVQAPAPKRGRQVKPAAAAVRETGSSLRDILLRRLADAKREHQRQAQIITLTESTLEHLDAMIAELEKAERGAA